MLLLGYSAATNSFLDSEYSSFFIQNRVCLEKPRAKDIARYKECWVWIPLETLVKVRLQQSKASLGMRSSGLKK